VAVPLRARRTEGQRNHSVTGTSGLEYGRVHGRAYRGANRMIKREELERLFREANDRAEAEEYEEAIGVYREVLDRAGGNDPLAAECAHWGIGELSLGMRDYETAAGAMLAALAINPNEAAYHYLLGIVFFQLGARAQALSALERAHELEPNKPMVLRAYGWALYQNGENLRGFEMLKTALALRPDDHRTLTRLGWAFAFEGRTGEAQVCLERALEMAPWDLEAQVALSTIDRLAGSPDPRPPLPASGPSIWSQEDDWDDDEDWEDDDVGDEEWVEEDDDDNDDWEDDEDWEDEEEDWSDDETVDEDAADDDLIDIG